VCQKSPPPNRPRRHQRPVLHGRLVAATSTRLPKESPRGRES
jgi:hypothetical protein